MNPVREIAVLGTGVAAWCAAASFAARLRMAVTVVEDPDAAPQLADLFGAAGPSAILFHRDIRLDEAEVLARADAVFRLGTRFEGWTEDRPPYLHGYGEHGQPIGSAAFHQHWLRGDGVPFGAYSAAAMLAASGRFAHPTDDDGPLGAYAYGLTVDPVKYRGLMRGHARRLGATAVPGRLARLERDGAGFATAAVLADGARVTADLFVDAGGLPDEGGDWESWARWLPCDEALLATAPPLPETPPHDWAVADATGWRLVSPTRDRVLHAHVHPRALAKRAAEMLPRATARFAFRQGRRAAPWVRNVVAIGDRATCVEPLDAVPLHLVHAQVDRIIAALPGRAMNPVEVADHNRRSGDEVDRVRDFLALHYVTARRDEPFWRERRDVQPPDRLAADLALFAERGRLRIYDGETFDRESWLSLLIGQGVIPRRRDPLAEEFPAERLPVMLYQMREAVRAAVTRVPRHDAYLARMLERAG